MIPLGTNVLLLDGFGTGQRQAFPFGDGGDAVAVGKRFASAIYRPIPFRSRRGSDFNEEVRRVFSRDAKQFESAGGDD